MRNYGFFARFLKYMRANTLIVSLIAVLSLAAGGVMAKVRSTQSYIRITTSIGQHTPAILSTLIPTLKPNSESPMPTNTPNSSTPTPSPSTSGSPKAGSSNVSIHIENNTGGSNNSSSVETNSDSSCTNTINSNDQNIAIHVSGDGKLTSDPKTGTYTVNGKNCSVNINSNGNNTSIESNSSSSSHITSNSSSNTQISVHSSTSNR